MDNYKIIIQGHIDKRRFRDFSEIQLEQLSTGETKITCMQFDQAALQALLTKVYDLGLILQSLEKGNCR